MELLYSYISRVVLLLRHARMDSPQPKALQITFLCKRRASFVPLTIYPISISFVLRYLNLYLIDLLGNNACHRVTWTFTRASKLLLLYLEIDLRVYSFLCFLELKCASVLSLLSSSLWSYSCCSWPMFYHLFIPISSRVTLTMSNFYWSHRRQSNLRFSMTIDTAYSALLTNS